MTPLPCRRAARHSAAKAASGTVPIGCSRTSRPSPVGIGAERPGQAPRRSRRRWARARSCHDLRLQRGKARSDIVAMRMPKPLRRASSSRSAIAAAAAGFSRSKNSRTAAIGDIGVVQQIEQMRRQLRRWFAAKATRRSTVSASSAAPRRPWRICPAMKRGLTARARTMRAKAADSARARGRCGSVISSITRSTERPRSFAAAAKPPTKAASSAPSRRSRAGSSLTCTSVSAPAMRCAKAPGAASASPSAPP